MSRLSDFFRGVDGAASSGATVNTVATLNIPEDINLYVDPNGGEWLRNGHFITSSFASYPNALTSSNITNFNIFAEKELDVNNDSGKLADEFTLKPDGSVLYIQGSTSTSDGGISIYNLSTPWDISTATYVTGSPIGKDSFESANDGLFFDNTGNFLFQNDVNGDFIKYTLPSAYDLTSFTSSSIVNPAGISTTGGTDDVKISSDGLHIYGVSSGRLYIQRTELDAAYATTSTINNNENGTSITDLIPSYFNLSGDVNTTDIRGYAINTDGTRVILAADSDVYPNDTMFLLCEMTTAHTLSTLSVIKHYHIPNFKVNRMHFNYTLTNGIVKAEVNKGKFDSLTDYYFSVSLDDSIGISKNINQNLFLKIK